MATPLLRTRSPIDLTARPAAATARARRGGLIQLRLRAWRLRAQAPDCHPVAELIARGEWSTLDRLVDELAEG